MQCRLPRMQCRLPRAIVSGWQRWISAERRARPPPAATRSATALAAASVGWGGRRADRGGGGCTVDYRGKYSGKRIVRNINKKKNATYTLSTSEDPLWEQLDRYGPRGIRGEEVRMIDVPACVSDMRDIFDGEHAQAKVGETVEQRCRFVEDQERLTKTYQGEALRAYLAKRACDKTAKATLKRYMKEYTDHAPLPGQQRWLGRIQRLFAAVYAGAAQAIDYGVLPWGKKRTLTAIRACMADAMEKLIANSADDCERGRGSGQSDQSMLAEFNLRLDGATFVRLNRNRRKKKVSATRLTAADGVIRPTKPRKCEYLLFGRTMKAWYPEVSARQRLTKLLRSHRILKGGRRADTNTRQVLIAELGTKVPCYGLVRKRLKGFVTNVQ